MENTTNTIFCPLGILIWNVTISKGHLKKRPLKRQQISYFGKMGSLEPLRKDAHFTLPCDKFPTRRVNDWAIDFPKNL